MGFLKKNLHTGPLTAQPPCQWQTWPSGTRYQRVRNPVSFHSDAVEWRGLAGASVARKDCGLLTQSLHLKSPRVVSPPYLAMPIMNSPSAFFASPTPRHGQASRKACPLFSVCVSQLYNTNQCHCHCERKDKQSKCPGILRDLKRRLRNGRKLQRADLLARKWRADPAAAEDVTILQTGAVPK